MKVKICGLKRVEDALMLNEFKNIQYAGFVFAPTKRQVTIEQAIEIKKALRYDIKCVGVFTETSPEDINFIASAVGLDICQLHSNETNEDCRNVKYPVWKALRIKDEDSIKEALQFKSVTGFVLDKYKLKEYGGTGEAFDWSVVKNFSDNHFTVLAGGIDKHNIMSAVEAVKPDVVDLSSSVEVDGYKNYDKIKEFMAVADSIQH